MTSRRADCEHGFPAFECPACNRHATKAPDNFRAIYERARERAREQRETNEPAATDLGEPQ